MRATWIPVFLAACVACVPAFAEEPDPVNSETAVQQSEVPLHIPASAKARKNPLPPNDENLELGTNLYTSQCAMCHGARGAGDGDLGGKLGMTLPDFTDPAQQRKRTDGELFYILTKGHGRMPAEGERLSEEYRWSMILAIRQMGR